MDTQSSAEAPANDAAREQDGVSAPSRALRRREPSAPPEPAYAVLTQPLGRRAPGQVVFGPDAEIAALGEGARPATPEERELAHPFHHSL